MGIFNIKWATGQTEQVEQSDCHDVGMFINTKFGGGTTQESLADNGVHVDQVIEHSVFEQLTAGFHDVVQRVENGFEKLEDKVEDLFDHNKSQNPDPADPANLPENSSVPTPAGQVATPEGNSPPNTQTLV